MIRNLLWCALLPACVPDLSLPKRVAISCDSGADCPTGQVCVLSSHRCVDPAGDTDAPVLAGEVKLSRLAVGKGMRVDATFGVKEALPAPPELTFDDGTAWQLDPSARPPLYLFYYIASGEEQEEARGLTLRLADELGNATTVAAGEVRFDFTPPVVGSFSWADGALVIPSTSTVGFTATSEPAISVVHARLVPLDGSTPATATAIATPQANQTSIEGAADVSGRAGDVVIELDVMDEALNGATFRSPVLTIDGTPPLSPLLAIEGKPIVKSTTVTIQLSAVDATEVRISGDILAGGAWTPFDAASKTVELTPVIGTKTLTASFRDAAGNVSEAVSDSVYYTPLDDTAAPSVLQVSATDPNAVLVAFDEQIQRASAEDPSRYTITSPSGPLGVSGAFVHADSQTVTLITATQEAGAPYSLTVSGVEDFFGNAIGANVSMFSGFGTLPDPSPPDPLLPLDGARATTGNVLLRWTPRSKATTYTVEVATSPAMTSPTVYQSPTEALTISLAVSRTYYWRVRADVTTALQYSPARHFDVLADGVVYVYCPDDGVPPTPDTCTDVGRAGNRTNPLRTIGGAIALAKQIGAARVNIAARDNGEFYDELVVLRGGVSLYGGYHATDPPSFAADFASQDPVANPTKILRSGSMTVLGSEVSAPVTIDGLELHSAALGNVYALYVATMSAPLTVSRSKIIVPDGTGETSYGAYLAGVSAATLTASSISVGDAGTRSTALYAIDGAVTLQSVSLTSGNAAVGSFGLSAIRTAATLSRLTVRTGDTPINGNSQSIGVQTTGSVGAFSMDRSDVRAGAGNTSYGLYVNSASMLVTNNLLASGSTAGSTLGSFGMYVASPGIVAHNTILGGTTASGRSGGLVVGFATDVRIIDNIFSTVSPTGLRICLYATQTSGVISTLQNNLFFGCATALYHIQPSTNLTSIADVNTASLSTHSGNAASVAANITDTAVNVALDPSTLHLTAGTVAAVSQGGKDTLSATCGNDNLQSCGNVVVDFDGDARTVPVSIGADER